MGKRKSKNKCLELTVREHALITDMEGTYAFYPKRGQRVVNFAQSEKMVVDCWCENAKKIGVKKCTVTKGKKVWIGQVLGSDAVLLAEKHLESSGIITEKHRKKAEFLLEHPPRPYRRKRGKVA